MKKLYLYFTIVSLLFSASGCMSLEIDESTASEEKEILGTYDNIAGLLTNVYSYLQSDFGQLDGAIRCAATDDAVYTWEESDVYDIYNDNWSAINTVGDVWSHYYSGIFAANHFMETIHTGLLDDDKWNSDYAINIEKIETHLQEARMLRAYYYFELAKRYGDVPLVESTLSTDEANRIKKTDFHDVIDYIVSECDAVAPNLPVSHKNSDAGAWGDTGRVTRGFAMAVKARALLYAASPLHNTISSVNYVKRYIVAAEASYDIISSNIYSLPNIDVDPLFTTEGNDALSSPQLIFERRNSPSTSFEVANLPYGYYATVKGGSTPTENLAEMYEMTDGTPFSLDTYSKSIYSNRDPRFYKNIMYDGATYKGTEIKTYVGGANGQPIKGATLTGYYLRKYIYESVSIKTGSTTSVNHNYTLFRYAEVLLNYAEVMDVLVGADGTLPTCPMTARQAINKVRAAANMPDVDTSLSSEEFSQYIKDERRRELAFEDHRFWDIRRWKCGDVVKKIYGMRITRNASYQKEYEKVLVQERVWDDKMYLMPIPHNETSLNHALTQNKGWEI